MSTVDLDQIACAPCVGNGYVLNADGQPMTCPVCGGKGVPPQYRTEDWDDEPGLYRVSPLHDLALDKEAR